MRFKLQLLAVRRRLKLGAEQEAPDHVQAYEQESVPEVHVKRHQKPAREAHAEPDQQHGDQTGLKVCLFLLGCSQHRVQSVNSALNVVS